MCSGGRSRTSARRAHAFGRVAVLGGSSVSACPEHYPEFDYLHVGEMGDATDELFARLTDDVTRPPRQVVLTTKERRELTEFPIPAYELAQIDRYLLGSIQFSSGCPYQCEFCDIPALYGRVARYKTAEQVCAELDKLVACGLSTSVYFVDDNFIANKRAVREMLPHLIEWQKRNGYPLLLSCEATLNIAKRPEILELMREAAFTTIFCGIETPDPEALKSISKDHNMMVPILGAIETLNGFGMEVVSGIIIGLDTDTPDTGRYLLEFVEQSQIPMLTMNLLQALPRTPLWDRLKREHRLIEDDDSRESNVAFRMPYDRCWRCGANACASPISRKRCSRRYEHQIRVTYAKRLRLPNSPQRASWRNIRRALIMLSRIFWFVGVKGDYRRVFWRFALARLRRGEIEYLISGDVARPPSHPVRARGLGRTPQRLELQLQAERRSAGRRRIGRDDFGVRSPERAEGARRRADDLAAGRARPASPQARARWCRRCGSGTARRSRQIPTSWSAPARRSVAALAS